MLGLCLIEGEFKKKILLFAILSSSKESNIA